MIEKFVPRGPAVTIAHPDLKLASDVQDSLPDGWVPPLIDDSKVRLALGRARFSVPKGAISEGPPLTVPNLLVVRQRRFITYVAWKLPVVVREGEEYAIFPVPPECLIVN